ERDPNRERTKTELGEKFRVFRISDNRTGTGRLGDHAREITRKERRESGPEHPAAHHDPLVLSRGELADHCISNGRNEQLTNALEDIVKEQPNERALPIGAGQLDPDHEQEKGEGHQEERGGKLLWYVDVPSTRAQASEERREQRPAEDDADGVDILNPLRLNLHPPDHQIDVVDRE